MTKKLLVILFFCASVTAAAQDTLSYVARLLTEKRVSFSYNVVPEKKGALRIEGKATVDGACYKLSGNGLDIFCDGTTKWTVDSAAREVYIESSEGTREFLLDTEAWAGKVSGLTADGGKVSGIFNPGDGGESMRFTFTSIESSPLRGSTEGFVFDVEALDDEWVITDLR